MDPIELDLARREAGSEYLAAVRSLGLSPDALFWGFDQTEGRFVLMLVSRMVDLKGPLAVADLLFQAYNASATPKEIDPFVVRLHSPEQAIVREMAEFVQLSVRVAPIMVPGAVPGRAEARPATPLLTTGGMLFRQDWVYTFSHTKRPKTVDLSRRWRQFAHNVERLAA